MTHIIRTSAQLSSLLRSLRQAQGLSQAEFGKRIGLSQERISKIENNPEKVMTGQLMTVLMALGMHLAVVPRNLADTPGQGEAW